MGRCHGHYAYNERQTASSRFSQINYTGNIETAYYAHHFRPSDYGVSDESSLSRCAPRFSLHRSVDQGVQYWLGLNFVSNLDGDGLNVDSRPALNLAIVLDVSGSMSSDLTAEDGKRGEKRISVAKRNLLEVTKQLTERDRLTFMTFNTRAQVVQELTEWTNIVPSELADKVNELSAGGYTALTKALLQAAQELENKPDTIERQNRIILLTDMEANHSSDEEQFVSQVKELSERHIYTTIVGIGMDLSRNTVQETSRTPGCNYCNVREAEHFKNLMEQEFPFLVTPIAFNVRMQEAENGPWKIVRGYGSPEICQVPLTEIEFSSIFPSSANDKGDLRSGCFLFALEGADHTAGGELPPLDVTLTWADDQGNETQLSCSIPFEAPVYHCQETEADETTERNTEGVRKALLLKRFIDETTQAIARYNQAISDESSLPDEDHLEKFMAEYREQADALHDASLLTQLGILENVLKRISEVANARG